MRLINSELLRRVMRPACCSAALLIALTGCERGRNNEADAQEPRGPRFPLPWNKEKKEQPAGTNTVRYPKTLSVDEGEELPSPPDASRSGPVVKNAAPNYAPRNDTQNVSSGVSVMPNRNTGGGGNADQAIFILAGLAQEHDRFKQQLTDLDKRQGEFLPVQQEQAKQIKQLAQVSVPKLEQQMAAQQIETAKTAQGHTDLEKRVVALEEELRQLKQHRTTPPLGAGAPEIEAAPDEPIHNLLPSPQVKPKSPAAVADSKQPRTPSPVSLPETPGEVKKVSRFNPQQQVIRTKVRGIYERVIADFPGTQQAFDALLSLGAMAEEDQEWPAAAKMYEQAATEFPNRPESVNARFHLGRVLAASGNYAQAREAFLIIPDWNPNHPMATSALLQAGVALAKSGKLDAGVRELRHIEKTQPDSTFAQDAREQIVSLLYDGKRYDETLACYPAVSDGARPGRKLELQLLKAQAERRAKKYKDSAATLDGLFKAQATPEVRAAAKYEYADLMDEQSKTLDAARAFSDAAQEFPQNARMPEARLKASQLFLANELPETSAEQMVALLKAISDRTATEKDQHEPEALFILAKSQQSAGQMDASRKTLDDLRRKYPSHPRALSVEVEEARGLAERGAVKDATALLRNLIRNHPDAPQTAQAMLLLAELQERNPDKLQRANAYSDLLKQTAGSDDANTLELRRGLLLMELERSAEASAVFTTIADSNKAAPDLRLIARYQSAVAFQQSGQLEAAVVAYTHFLDGATVPMDPAPKNLPALVEDAKWKVEKLKWLKELTAPAVAPQAKSPATPKGTPEKLPVLTPPQRTQTM